MDTSGGGEGVWGERGDCGGEGDGMGNGGVRRAGGRGGGERC